MLRLQRAGLSLGLTLCFVAGCTNGPGSWKTPFRATQQAAATSNEAKHDLAMQFAKARNLESSGDYEKSRAIYAKLKKSQPRNAEVLHRLGVVADKQRRHQEAAGYYKLALQLNPNDAELHNDLGYSFYLQNRLVDAERALRQAIQLNPESPRFHINLAMAIGHQGRLDEAFHEFALAGSRADAYYNLASIHSFRGNFEEAKSCFRKALTVDPMHSMASQSLQNFQRFESSDQSGETRFADNTQGSVPYIESGDGMQRGRGSDVQRASYQAQLPNSRNISSANRQLHRDARGLMGRNMASQRNAGNGMGN